MYHEYKRAVEENAKLKLEAEEMQVTLRRAEKAKENYKEQTFDLKQEIKQLK